MQNIKYTFFRRASKNPLIWSLPAFLTRLLSVPLLHLIRADSFVPWMYCQFHPTVFFEHSSYYQQCPSEACPFLLALDLSFETLLGVCPQEDIS